MSIQRQATVTAEGEIRLHVPELAGQVVTVVLDRAAILPRTRPLGDLRGKIRTTENFDDPLPELEGYV